MGILLVKALHITAAFYVFAALGALILHAKNGGAPAGRKLAGLTHGLALIAVLVTGFATLGMFKYAFGLWVWLKLAIWLLLGALLAVVNRKPQWAGLLWWLVPLLGGAAAYLALVKPT